MRDFLRWLRTIPPERFVLALLVAVALGTWGGVAAWWPRPLTVTVFAVGDGDAVLVQAPGGKAVLYDGGSRDGAEVGPRVLVPNLLLRGVKHLDAIIVSHPDSDHINGLPAVLDAVRVDTVLESGVPCDTGTYAHLEAEMRRHHVPSQTVRAGDRLNLGGGATLAVLAPGAQLISGTDSDTNNNSLLCRLDYGASHLLLTGDAEEQEEHAAIAAGADVRAQVLLVAHHGSRHSTGEAFLAAVRPALAVVSTQVGQLNGLPSPDTLTRLRHARVRTYRTDDNGQVTLTTDGTHWNVATYRQ